MKHEAAVCSKHDGRHYTDFSCDFPKVSVINEHLESVAHLLDGH